MRGIFITMCAAVMLSSCTSQKGKNPFLADSDAPFGVPNFKEIRNEHYMPAIQKGMAEHNAEIEKIVNNQDAPTFENTVAALDRSGKLLNRVTMVLFSMTEAETNDTLAQIEEEVSPLLTAHSDNMMLNDKLFARVKAVYDNQANENLTDEQKMVLTKYYNDFVRSGALLDDQKKTELKEINKELGLLSIKFGNNVLAETNEFKIVVDKDSDLEGLPQWAVDAAAADAVAAGDSGKWVFTLHSPSRIPFLQYSSRRELREKMYNAYIHRGDNDNKNDNKEVIAQILRLRLKKAQLLGFDSYADFVLDDCMAKNSQNVYALLNRIWEYALPKAKEEAKDLQKVIDKENGGFKLAGWDWWYYTEKIRKERYSFDESEIKPYFPLDNVLDGAFMVAGKLFGVSFKELDNMPLYNKDVRAFEALDSASNHLAVFYVDYFPRAGKRAGAWMSAFSEQSIENGVNIRPVIYNVGNFTKPLGDTPSLLNIDEVRTLFHEFGHGLHGMLTQCTYSKVNGTNVARDFVELPSQIMEHWAIEPEVLRMYAKHYQTGEVIPDSLIEKMDRASKFNIGFESTELLAAAILDMDLHTIVDLDNFNADAAEKATAQRLGLIDEITYRYRATNFNHIFSGGYAVGYYSYLWAEVLDSDAFEAFKENGLFDQATALRYKTNILEKGGSVDPMVLYVNFRGAQPNPDALLRGRGLIK